MIFHSKAGDRKTFIGTFVHFFDKLYSINLVTYSTYVWEGGILKTQVKK